MTERIIASCIARALKGSRHAFVGTAAPLHGAGALLAEEQSNGGMRTTMLGSRNEMFVSDGGRELFDAAVQGRIDACLLGGGQIDEHGNLNFIGVGQYPDLKVRWPGHFGTPYLYTVVRKVVLVCEKHSRRVMVPKVDFTSAPGASPRGAWRPGGPACLITNLCEFTFNRERARFILRSIHAGVSKEEVYDNTGFAFDLSDSLSMTPEPTEEETALLFGPVAGRLRKTYPLFVEKFTRANEGAVSA